VRTHQREEFDLKSTRRLPNRSTAGLQQPQALVLDFTWWNSRFRWKTERGGSWLLICSSKSSYSGRKSRLYRQQSVVVAHEFGSVTTRGEEDDWQAAPTRQRNEKGGKARLVFLGRPMRRRRGRKGQRPTYASAGETGRSNGPSGRQGEGKWFSSFFLLSFLYLLVFKLFQIKFFKPNQNKIK
jgi:hypothetical protein